MGEKKCDVGKSNSKSWRTVPACNAGVMALLGHSMADCLADNLKRWSLGPSTDAEEVSVANDCNDQKLLQ